METKKYRKDSSKYQLYINIQNKLLLSKDTELITTGNFMRRLMELYFMDILIKQKRSILMKEFPSFSPYNKFSYYNCLSDSGPEKYDKAMDTIVEKYTEIFLEKEKEEYEASMEVYSHLNPKYLEIYLNNDQYNELIGFIWHGQGIGKVRKVIAEIGIKIHIPVGDIVGIRLISRIYNYPNILLYFASDKRVYNNMDNFLRGENTTLPYPLCKINKKDVELIYRFPFANIQKQKL